MQRLKPSERYLNEMLCMGLSENGVYHVYPYTHHFSILDHFSTENVDDPLELLDNQRIFSTDKAILKIRDFKKKCTRIIQSLVLRVQKTTAPCCLEESPKSASPTLMDLQNTNNPHRIWFMRKVGQGSGNQPMDWFKGKSKPYTMFFVFFFHLKYMSTFPLNQIIE